LLFWVKVIVPLELNPVDLIIPLTSNLEVGVVVPMPTLPLVESVISAVPLALLMTALGVAEESVAPKYTIPPAEEYLTPMAYCSLFAAKNDRPPCTSSFANELGLAVPTPTLPLYVQVKGLAESAEGGTAPL
jgi:hypothetical protein